MKTQLVATGLLLLAGIGAHHGLLACGDKFLVVSRGTRFERAAAVRRPAAILVYVNPASAMPKALANLSVDATLQKAGYRPTSVASTAAFERALSQGGWDLVVVDVTDGPTVSNRLQGSGGPVVLPVIYNATSTELKQIKKQYPHVLKSPTKNQSFIDAIDEALSSRPGLELKSGGKTNR